MSTNWLEETQNPGDETERPMAKPVFEAALKSAGFGLGQHGSAPGRFYDFPSPPMAPPIPISGNTPR